MKNKIFQIDKITQVDKSLLLTLSNNIDNPCVYFNSNEKYRTTAKTIDILKRRFQYTDDEIFEGIVTLCIKRLIVIRNDLFSGQIEFFTKDKHNNIEIDTTILAEVIYSILHTHRNLLNDESIVFSDKDKDISYIHTMEYLQTDPQVLAEARKHDEKIKDTIQARIQLYQDLGAKDLLKSIALDFFDKDKILNSNFIFLTAFKNAGISGIELAEYIYREEMEEKISSFIKMESRIDPMENKINELGEKVDHHLLRNIEAISIFVAVITLLVGNVSLLPQIASHTSLIIAGLILIINGCLLVGVSTLVQLISKIVMGRTTCENTFHPKRKSINFYPSVMVFSVALILIGIGLLILDSYIL